MDHVLSVSLDKSTTPWAVDIDQHGDPNHVDRSPSVQTIAWELSGDASTGQLLSMRWLDPVPPAGIFGLAQLADNGKRMTLTDLNNSPDTRGTWDYWLSLCLDGQEYCTRATLPIDTSTNPSIKNN